MCQQPPGPVQEDELQKAPQVSVVAAAVLLFGGEASSRPWSCAGWQRSHHLALSPELALLLAWGQLGSASLCRTPMGTSLRKTWSPSWTGLQHSMFHRPLLPCHSQQQRFSLHFFYVGEVISVLFSCTWITCGLRRPSKPQSIHTKHHIPFSVSWEPPQHVLDEAQLSGTAKEPNATWVTRAAELSPNRSLCTSPTATREQNALDTKQQSGSKSPLSQRITGSPRLGKTSKITGSKHQASPTTLFSTNPCPQGPHPHVFQTLPRTVTPPLLWAACARPWSPYQWWNFPNI